MNEKYPSKEAIRSIQAFLLDQGKLKQVKVSIEMLEPGVTDQVLSTTFMYMSSGQVKNLREAMRAMAEETKKRRDHV